MALEEMFRAAVEADAQSLMIKAGDVFRARVHGKLVRLADEPFTAEDTRRIAQQILPDYIEPEAVDELTDIDFAWALSEAARFRVNILRQRESIMIVMRVLPWDIPKFEDLNLPSVLEEFADLNDGLILVTGATGVGKSTTQAAIVGWINRHRRKHIITLEDPIEYDHPDELGTVTQREVGKDTESFRTGLRMALRQDPDVILIGEMRDPETLEIALEASETGQLMISTFHAPTAASTLGHFIAMFPGRSEELVRKRVAESLRAVISQKLLPIKEGQGRVPAVEILRNTPTVQDAIVNDASPDEIIELMEQGDQYGMRTFDQHLMQLVRDGEVTYEIAKSAAVSPSNFELVMQTLAGDEDAGGRIQRGRF